MLHLCSSCLLVCTASAVKTDVLIHVSVCVFTLPPQNSFYHQLSMQKKSEKFFKVFYDRLRLAQQEIRATVSVNMSELSCRKRDDDGDVTGVRLRRGMPERLVKEEWLCEGQQKSDWKIIPVQTFKLL